MLEIFLNSNGFAFDCETESISGKKKDNLHFKRNDVVCISFANEEHSICLTKQEILEEADTFISLMCDPKYKKIGHNIKFDAKCVTGAFNLHLKGLWYDTHIAACLLDENEPHGLKPLCKKYLKTEWGEWSDQESLETLKEYCRLDSVNTWNLAKYQKSKLEQQRLWKLFKIEMEVVDVFYHSEVIGIPIELDYLKNLSQKYSRHIAQVSHWIYNHTQEEFNINSPQQLANVLFNLKKLPILKKSPAGAPSTDTKTLKFLSKDGHRFVDAVLLYRHWEMLRRHIDKLVGDSIDGKIYATFNTVGAETGRFSCKEPNLQQIPSKTKESLAIRQGFTGNLLVADYSNVELRLLAHFSGDPRLLAVYGPEGSGDLHAYTAELLGISRSHAKTINFGIGYGMGPRKLAEDLDIPEDQAKKYIEDWYKTYSMVQRWKDLIINTCKRYGYINSIYGRKRRIDFAKIKYNKKWQAERELINFAIQGSSADITKLAIQALKDEDIRIQVHDELVIYNPKRSLEEIKSIMEGVVKLRIPLTVDIKHCNNWMEGK